MATRFLRINDEKQKVENNMDLSSDEKFLKMRSTLSNWENNIIYWYV